MVLPLLAEGIREPREAARPHADAQVLAFHYRRADTGRIGTAHDCPPEVNLSIAGMDDVAELTGGRAFHDDNGLSALARAALDDSREGYVLTYTPNNYRQDGSPHKVQLRTSRKGVELRYRPGYIAN